MADFLALTIVTVSSSISSSNFLDPVKSSSILVDSAIYFIDKNNKEEKQNYTYKGKGDKVIVVHLDGKSATNKFQYKVKAKVK